MTQKQVRAKDVAKEAGVSIGTVSRVLSGNLGRISDSTKDRVIAAAERMHYKPDALGRSLRTGSSRTLGLIIPDLGDQYFQYIARGAEAAARERGYGIVLCNTDRDSSRETQALDFLSDKAVDGVVLCGGGLQDDEHVSDYELLNLQVVSIGPHRSQLPNLAVANHEAMHTAISHLATTGRQRILRIAGQPDWLTSRTRLSATEDAIRSLGLDTDPALVRYSGFTAEAGAAATNAALAEGIEFDAVLAFNDYAAVGAMSVLAGSGHRVPHDIAIVGCDDTDIAAYARVPLTTIRFPAEQMGITAVKVLCDGAPVPAEPFSYEFIVRQSTIGASHNNADLLNRL